MSGRAACSARASRASGREQAVLAVEGLDVHLGGRRILSDVTFQLQAGEFTGLIGANGAGKTTLLRAILGLVRPSAGQVRLDGQPLSRERPTSRRRRGSRPRATVGYVPQKFLLDPDVPLRARDLVALGLDGHRLGFALPSRARRNAVQEMLEAVDASHFADARVGRLSGGEQQRIMIAHALISRPRLLLLDEPLANLDLASGQEVVALLARIAHEQGIAVLLSAHEMNSLLPVMDGIVYLAAGRAASGAVGEVIRTEVLSELYGHHVDVIHVGDRVVVLAGTADADPEAAGHHGNLEVVR